MLLAPRRENAIPRILRSLGLLPLLLLTVQGSATDQTYAAGIRAWQQEHDPDVRTGGWLLLIGRYEVAAGASSIGSDPGSTIVLPEGAPRRLGVLTRTASDFQFAPASGVAATIDGAPAAATSSSLLNAARAAWVLPASPS